MRIRRRSRLRSKPRTSSGSSPRTSRILFTLLSGLVGYIADDISKPDSRIKKLYHNLRYRLTDSNPPKLENGNRRQLEEIEVQD